MHPIFAELFMRSDDAPEAHERRRLGRARRSRQFRTVSQARGKSGVARTVLAGKQDRDLSPGGTMTVETTFTTTADQHRQQPAISETRRHLYGAETALHIARQSGAGAWMWTIT